MTVWEKIIIGGIIFNALIDWIRISNLHSRIKKLEAANARE